MIIGIDPGVVGAIAIVDGDDIVEIHDMPTIEIRGKRRVDASLLAELAGKWRGHAVLEHVQGVQGAGASSSFAFGRGFGIVEGVIAGVGLPLTLVRPQVWTKALNVSRDKGSHRAAAARLWPRHAGLFARVRDDGRADAALLAHWWNRASFGTADAVRTATASRKSKCENP
jgi:crossover junction endodeoxyribonuclease RuvC